MNPSALLALIGDLYAQITELSQQNDRLRNEAAERASTTPASSQHGGPL